MSTNSTTRLALICLAALACVVLAAPAAFAGDQDFTVVNKTGMVIHKLFVAPHSSDDWEEDVLGSDTLGIGESLEISFSRGDKTALWDLKIEDGEGNSYTWEKLNLLKITKVTLHYKNGNAWADVE